MSLHTGINLRISGNDCPNLSQSEQAELQASFAQLTKRSVTAYLLNVCFQILHVSARLAVASFHEMNNDCINGGLMHLKVSMC